MPADAKKPAIIDRGIMPIVILTIVALISVFSLALVERITANARAAQVAELKLKNQRLLFPKADRFESIDVNAYKGEWPALVKIDKAISGDATIGFLIEAAHIGYSGPLPVLTGIDAQGHVVGIRILENNETPGIGKKVETDSYRSRFIGQDAHSGLKVDTISGATISSSAVNAAVSDALKAFTRVITQGQTPKTAINPVPVQPKGGAYDQAPRA